MKAHDVRRMRTCCLCRELGVIGGNLIRLYLSDQNLSTHQLKNMSTAHPECYRKERGTAALLRLHPDQLGTVRIADVPPWVLRRILDRLAGKTRQRKYRTAYERARP